MQTLLMSTFASPTGGNYVPGFDISDDALPTGEKISRSEVFEVFKRFGETVKDFEKKNPTAPKMLVLHVTAHGREFEGEFKIQLSEEEFLSGREISQLLKGLGLDEVIIFLQACESGGFATEDVPLSYPVSGAASNSIADRIRSESSSNGAKVYVVVPVSELLQLEMGRWEEILASSVKKAIDDSNRDGTDVVTYAKWKRSLLDEVCHQDDFMPRNYLEAAFKTFRYWDPRTRPVLPRDDEWEPVGLDPQFYETGTLEMPLFLSLSGLTKWFKGVPNTPPPSSSGNSLDMYKNCREYEKMLMNSALATPQDLLKADENDDGWDRRALFKDFRYRRWEPEQALPVIQRILTGRHSAGTVYSALGYMAERFRESEARQVDIVEPVKALLKRPDIGCGALFESLIAVAPKYEVGTLAGIYPHAQNCITGEKRNYHHTIGFLGATRDPALRPFLRERLNVEKDDFYRTMVATALLEVRDPDSFVAAMRVLDGIDIWIMQTVVDIEAILLANANLRLEENGVEQLANIASNDIGYEPASLDALKRIVVILKERL